MNFFSRVSLSKVLVRFVIVFRKNTFSKKKNERHLCSDTLENRNMSVINQNAV